mmetsp:Transcript_125430/g.360401  ORF Transcript_125430/g.360401 Transcript_125430/m.360401 type:complete len:265 (+) Transcript_125430:180-974(+)
MLEGLHDVLSCVRDDLRPLPREMLPVPADVRQVVRQAANIHFFQLVIELLLHRGDFGDLHRFRFHALSHSQVVRSHEDPVGHRAVRCKMMLLRQPCGLPRWPEDEKRAVRRGDRHPTLHRPRLLQSRPGEINTHSAPVLFCHVDEETGFRDGNLWGGHVLSTPHDCVDVHAEPPGRRIGRQRRGGWAFGRRRHIVPPVVPEVGHGKGGPLLQLVRRFPFALGYASELRPQALVGVLAASASRMLNLAGLVPGGLWRLWRRRRRR